MQLSLKHVPGLLRVTGIVGANEGDCLPGSPELTGSAYVQFHFGNGATLRADAQYMGETFVGFGGDATPGYIRYGDFAIVNLRATIVVAPVMLGAFVETASDSDGARSANPGQIQNGFEIRPPGVYRIAPRTIGVTSSCRY